MQKGELLFAFLNDLSVTSHDHDDGGGGVDDDNHHPRYIPITACTAQ
jgi:hypothetical protein